MHTHWRTITATALIATLAAVSATAAYQMFRFRDRLHDQTDNSRLQSMLAENNFYAARKIVFFGDSQIARWQIRPSFGVMPIVNKGISGDWATKAIHRFDNDVLAERPAAVVILIGTNDLGNAQPAETIVASVETMIDRAASSGITVIVCGLLPARDAQHPIERLNGINRAYRALAEKYGAEFVDFTAPLADEAGLLRSSFTSDGLHANDAGYLIMARTLYPALARVAW